MLNYEAATDNFTDYKQTVEYTLQFKQYIGKFRVNISGNARGRAVLDWDFDVDMLSDASEVDFIFSEGEEYLTVFLVDPITGETCEFEDTPDEFNNYIVKAEIVKVVKNNKE